jgi:hypothetical protein
MKPHSDIESHERLTGLKKGTTHQPISMVHDCKNAGCSDARVGAHEMTNGATIKTWNHEMREYANN